MVPEGQISGRGFTLLELLIAMAVGALIMAATYTMISDTLRAQKDIAARAGELADMHYMRRTLLKDILALRPAAEGRKNIRIGRDSLELRCRGDVQIGGMPLGPEVWVRYAWFRLSGKLIFTRQLNSLDAGGISLYDVRIKGLRKVSYELMGKDGRWQRPDDFTGGEPVAVRWHFYWLKLGRWDLVMAFKNTI